MSNNMTWHCKLILDNDQECAGVCDCLTVHVMSRVYHDYAGRAYGDQNKARVYILSQFLKNYIEELVDIGNEYNYRNQMGNELILGAVQEIDFRQIAEDMIADYTPKSPAEVADNEEFFKVMGFSNYDIDED